MTTSLPQCQQLTHIVTHFMQTAKESLAQIITSLESDLLLEQMRNDSNLYHEKISYIMQLVEEHFVLQPINPMLVKQIQELKHAKIELQAKIEESKDQYISELSNIEVQYKEFLLQKENEKRSMQNQIEKKDHEIFMLNKDSDIKNKRLEEECEKLKREVETLRERQGQHLDQIDDYRRSTQRLTKQLHQLRQIEKQHSQQKNLKSSQLSIKTSHLQNQNQDLKQQLQLMEQEITSLKQSEQSYLQTIENMKQDMFLIKTQWEKRCEQVERDLGESYRNRLVQHEEEMNEKLKMYMEELKMGKSVIIQSSEEILESKRVLMEQRLNLEIKRYQEEINELDVEVKELKQKLKQSLNQLNQKDEELKAKEFELNESKSKLQKEIRSLSETITRKQEQSTQKLTQIKSQTDKQIQRLHRTESMLLKDLQKSKHEKEQIQRQVNAIRDEFNSHKEKQSKESKRLKEIQSTNEANTTKILQLKKDIAILNEKNSMDEKTIKDKSNEITRLENNLVQSRNDCKEMENIVRKLEVKSAEYNLKIKELERIKSQQAHRLQKLYLLVRKLPKQLSLIKQDITYQITHQKTKLQSIMLSLKQRMQLQSEQLRYTHKQTISSLLSQFQQQRRQQKQLSEEVVRQNDNMKKELRLLEQLMQEKEEDFVYGKERAVNSEVEKCRVVMLEEVKREREERRRVEEKLYGQEKKYEYMLARAEKEVVKNVQAYQAKWEGKLAQLNQALLAKEKQVNALNGQLKKVLAEHDAISMELQQSDEKLSKFQKKYQNLKQQRDRTIDEMMKRLQKQTRAKLSLQRQLKDIRGQIMKTQQANTNSSSPFNNYSFTDRQNTNVYVNAFQATTQDKMKTQVKSKDSREKELSEIREMIARTYKMREGAEKDSPGNLNKGKLF